MAQGRSRIGPVATFYGPRDEGWAACLMLDLRARGVEVWDHANPPGGRAAIAAEAGALLVVHSWFSAVTPESSPTLTELSAVGGRGPYVTARRNWTKLSIDRPPGPVITLWDDYYQPALASSGHVSGGFANLLELFLGSSATLDLPPGYVFISYRYKDNQKFVQDTLRPCLARAGITSWAYRLSERLSDVGIADRLEELIKGASALLVVATSQWSPWTNLELELARRHGVRVVRVRPPKQRSVPQFILDGGHTHVLQSGAPSAARLVAALRQEGVRAFGEGAFGEGA